MKKHYKLLVFILVVCILASGSSFVSNNHMSQIYADATPAPTPSYVLTLSNVVVPIDVNPPGISVSGTQQITYQAGTVVTLKAYNRINPDGSGYYFVQWQGDITSSANPVSITMNKNMTVRPVFAVGDPIITPTPTIAITATPTPTSSSSPHPAEYSVTTDPATSITATSAILNGTLTQISPPQGMYADDFFHWYYSPSLTSVQNRTAPTVTTNGLVYGNAKPFMPVTGLTPNTTYYVQAFAYGKYGQILSLTTLPSGTTPTPTVPNITPTPVPSGSIKVQFYNQNLSATSNQIYPNIKIINTGNTAITLSTVKIRYYYTIDGVKSQNFYCDYSSVGSSNVTGTFVTMATAKTGADTYLEVGFTSGAGSLAAGATAVIQTRFAKSDWTNYTQTNDYSFNSTATNYVEWTKITGYVSGSLQWGTEP